MQLLCANAVEAPTVLLTLVSVVIFSWESCSILHTRGCAWCCCSDFSEGLGCKTSLSGEIVPSLRVLLLPCSSRAPVLKAGLTQLSLSGDLGAAPPLTAAPGPCLWLADLCFLASLELFQGCRSTKALQKWAFVAPAALTPTGKHWHPK